MITLINKTAHGPGACITVAELLEAINAPAFKGTSNEAPVFLNKYEERHEALTFVFKCPDCDNLHLESGYTDGEEPEAGIGFVIYMDRRQYRNAYVSRGQLMDILKLMSGDMQVAIAVQADDATDALTHVYKCSEECDSLHLESSHNILEVGSTNYDYSKN